MNYLIKEETNMFTSSRVITKIKNLGNYEFDNEQEVNDYCRNKTRELKGTYDEDKFDKVIYYEELTKLN
jgi:hypothetical protein